MKKTALFAFHTTEANNLVAQICNLPYRRFATCYRWVRTGMCTARAETDIAPKPFCGRPTPARRVETEKFADRKMFLSENLSVFLLSLVTDLLCHADCKSAIQQITNLRYWFA